MVEHQTFLTVAAHPSSLEGPTVMNLPAVMTTVRDGRLVTHTLHFVQEELTIARTKLGVT